LAAVEAKETLYSSEYFVFTPTLMAHPGETVSVGLFSALIHL
jgi:hypothetical protein